jgi:hypothetical protein
MKVQVLYFDGCPTYGAAVKTLRKVLADEGVQAEVELVAVDTDKDARSLRFPGSPTIRVDGRDLFPAPERENWRLGCRVYKTPEGLRGSPTAAMLGEALTKMGAAGADRVDPDDADMSSVEAIWGTFCHHLFFFASREEAERWAAGRHDIEILSVEEAYELVRLVSSRFLAYGE